MISQHIWSTLKTIGEGLVNSRKVFGLQVAFDYSPTNEDGGLSQETRDEMIKLHASLLYGILINYGLQGCRIHEPPTYTADEVYMPTNVFLPGSEKAIFITPARAPAMPVVDNSQPVAAAASSPTPSQPKPARARKGTGPAKPRGKKGAICIPTVHQEEQGALLSLETGEKVPVAGLSKNQIKKRARQFKQDMPKECEELTVAFENKDYETASRIVDVMKAKQDAEIAAKANNNNKASGILPPPKRQRRESKAMREAFAEGQKAIASGKAEPPPTRGRGRGKSVAPNTSTSSAGPASQPFSANAASTSSDSASHVSTPSPYRYGGPPVQAQPQAQQARPSQFARSPLEVNQSYQAADCPQAQQSDNQYQQPQQQLSMDLNIDPQLFAFPGQIQQPSVHVAQLNTGYGIMHKENQLPAPASVNDLLKVNGSIASPGQQVDGIDITPIDNVGQHGQVVHQGQPSQAGSSAIFESIDGIDITPVGNPTNTQTERFQAQPGAPRVARLADIQSFNGMPVTNGELQTNGYSMQPLAAVMPRGAPPKSTRFGSRAENQSTTAAQTVVFPETAALTKNDVDGGNVQLAANEDLDMEDLFGPEGQLSGLDALTQDDLEQEFGFDGYIKADDERIARELAEDAANLKALEDFNNAYNDEAAMPQFDGVASPRISNEITRNNQDSSTSQPSSVLATAAARAQQDHQSNIARPAQGGQSTPTVANPANTAPAAATPEQIRAHEVYKQHLLHTQRDLAAQRARDNRRNRYLAADRDLPGEAERERRAARKAAHERIAQLRYVTAQAVAFPEGHAQRAGFEEAIAEMARLEGEVREMGDVVLMDREYAVVRERGYRCEEHWIPEIRDE